MFSSPESFGVVFVSQEAVFPPCCLQSVKQNVPQQKMYCRKYVTGVEIEV